MALSSSNMAQVASSASHTVGFSDNLASRLFAIYRRRNLHAALGAPS